MCRRINALLRVSYLLRTRTEKIGAKKAKIIDSLSCLLKMYTTQIPMDLKKQCYQLKKV